MFRNVTQTLIVLAFVSTARAELPVLRLDRVFPFGAAAGSTIELTVNAADDDDVKELKFDRPGFKAELSENRKFKLSIDESVPAGTYDVRLVGRFGVSNSLLFAVSKGLTEIAEKEKNNGPSDAQPIEVNSVVNAASNQNEIDYFRLTISKGVRVCIDCQAGKLDSQMDGVLAVSTDAGQLLASSGDYHGRDPFLDFVAPADGHYVIAVNDLSFRGGFPYRLVVTTHPHIENIYPRAMQAGQISTLLALGRNLGPGSQPSNAGADGPGFDTLQFQATAPTDLLALGEYRFFDHPCDHTVLPTAATCTLTGFQLAPRLDHVLRPQPMLVTESPVSLEAEPNDDGEHAQPLTLPAVLSGRFDRARDVDTFLVQSPEPMTLQLEVYCERIAGRADPYVIVTDEKDAVVAELDDFGHRINAFDGHLRDPVGTVTLTANKPYRIAVADRYSRGGPRYQYVLVAGPARPDFYVAAIHRQNPGPAGLSIRRGGTEFLDVIIHRTSGFSGPITLEARDLPPGMHSLPTTIHDSRGTFVLWSDHDAPVQVAPVRIVASGLQGERRIERLVRPYTRIGNQANINSSRPLRELMVATCETAPFAVSVEPKQLAAEAGKEVELKIVVTRHWPDASAPIQIAPLGFQGNFQMPAREIGGGQTEITFKIMVQAGTPPGDYTMALQCQSQVPFNKVADAKDRPNTLVTVSTQPFTLNVVKPPK